MGVSYYTCDGCNEAYPEHWSGGDCEKGHSFCEGCSEDTLYELQTTFEGENPQASEEAVEEYMSDIKWNIPQKSCPCCIEEWEEKAFQKARKEDMLKQFDEMAAEFRKLLEAELK